MQALRKHSTLNKHQVPVGTKVPADVGVGGYMKWSNQVLLLLWHEMSRSLEQHWLLDAQSKASVAFVERSAVAPALAEGPGSKRARQDSGPADEGKGNLEMPQQLRGGGKGKDHTFTKRLRVGAPAPCGVDGIVVLCSEGTDGGDLDAGSGIGRGGGCVVCWESEAVVALNPCGHVCLCVKCVPQQHTCPMCRAAVSGTLRVYFTAVS